jgi:FK506-binding nuclear protein
LGGLSDEEDFSEEDELDDVADPHIMEVDSEEEEAPKLIKAGKASKKRAADDSDDDGADILKKVLKAETPAVNGEKLSKSQKKKLKNNAGQAAEAPVADAKAGAEKKSGTKKETPAKNGKEQVNGSDKKKVQFAEKLVQDQPTKSEPKADAKSEKKSDKEKKTWKVNGVTIDERKAGNGKQAKAGDKLGMRYIGKLKDGKVFDCKWCGPRHSKPILTLIQLILRVSRSNLLWVRAKSSRAGM